MNSIITQLSNTNVPAELVKQVDMKNLLKEFKADYDKLDNLKHARAKHEQRNWLSRWWNSDEMKDAELDAAELQASYAKKVGQLMLISVAQAKQLTEQQQVLTEQQHKIQQQTKQISISNQSITEQQHTISQQQTELEKLVKDYFELEGLTMDGAAKLIEIADDVQTTKAQIHAQYQQSSQQLQQDINQQAA